VMVVMALFVHFIPDERDPAGLIAAYRDALAPGSYLALSSATYEQQSEGTSRAVEMYKKSANPVTPRSSDELRALVDGFEIVDPGIVFIPEWRPDNPAEMPPDAAQCGGLALVARKN